ncbi:MAG TPA: PIN domain-containing protein [Candidatus Cloacimonetes bacterium]|nr:PIN domain-containing protein [Candidatus Cloacimonadota bacterium]
MESNLLFIDTSAFYAFLDHSDEKHQEIADIFEKRTEYFVTSNYILDELITLLRVRKISLVKIKPFIEALWNNEICKIIRITEEIDFEAWSMMKNYEEHLFSFTDCTSFIIMKNYNMKKVCTLDKHFLIAGFEVVS